MDKFVVEGSQGQSKQDFLEISDAACETMNILQ
jgi:hypothetical protein